MLGSLEQTARAAKTALEAARAEARTRQRDLAAKEQALEEVTKQLKGVCSEATRREVTFDTDVRAASEAEASIRREADQIGTLISTKRTDLGKARRSLSEHDRGADALERALATQGAAIRALQVAIEGYERGLEGVGLPREAQQAQIAARAEEELRRVRVLEELKQKVTSLEMALDAAATSAAAAQVTAHIRESNNQLTALHKEQSEYKSWIKYFEDIQAKLQETQIRAVTKYTEGYGPLTSIIQRRLRTVLGFEDISLRPEEGAINVWVAHSGELLPPTDFFSQSQQQVLILSLFLTACITQTWSAFAPILLDDPVAHFDDLNAYCFFDLIDGLLESGLPRRQFILSTCDDRLFELAQHRFRYLGERRRVYRFISCGLDGPVIESV
jgi:exonuclease SbcC